MEYLDELSNDVLADYVRGAGAWDDSGVQERMKILGRRAGVALWEMYKTGMSDDVDQAVTAADDILGWVNLGNEDDDWDDKVWKAGEVLENLIKDPCPYESCGTSEWFEGWPSVAEYIQCLLDVDLGI